MRRITLMILSTLAAIVMLFSYRTSTQGSAAAAASGALPPGIVTAGTATPALNKSKSAKSSKPSKSVRAATSLTINGTTGQTRYGPVQVQVNITGKRSSASRLCNTRPATGPATRSTPVPLPQLAAEVLRARSTQINTVSGATYTSNGYTSSLQSRPDTAHFA